MENLFYVVNCDYNKSLMNLVFIKEANDLETCFTYEVKYCYIEKKNGFSYNC